MNPPTTATEPDLAQEAVGALRQANRPLGSAEWRELLGDERAPRNEWPELVRRLVDERRAFRVAPARGSTPHFSACEPVLENGEILDALAAKPRSLADLARELRKRQPADALFPTPDAVEARVALLVNEGQLFEQPPA